MKTNIIITLSLILLPSCIKSELTDISGGAGHSGVIHFNTYTGKQGRAEDITDLNTEGTSFHIYAKDSHDRPYLINGEKYRYVADGQWEWENDQEWSSVKKYPLIFNAVYPHQSTTDTEGFEYSVSSEAAEQIDLLHARTQANTRPANGSVPFAFKHILSRIDFKVLTDPSVKAYIQSVKIWNVCKSAPYHFAEGWKEKKAVEHESFTYMQVQNPAQSVSGSATLVGKVTDAMMMMPQQVADAPVWVNPATWNEQALEKGAYIELVYRLTDHQGNDITGYEDAKEHPNYPSGGVGPEQLFIKVAYPLQAAWKSGTKYTYTISLGTKDSSGGINTEDNFVDENGKDTELPVIDPNPGTDPSEPINPGEPVTDADKVIDFTIGINPWNT
ncbi:MAG: fimbrillin family protein [Bacteroidales bacterium]